MDRSKYNKKKGPLTLSPPLIFDVLTEEGDSALNFRSNWDNAADDAVALRMDEEYMEKVTEMARKRNALMPNQWVNNAAQDADVMKTYGEDNCQRLRAISDKYDEMKTFQKLCPGGYKLGA